MEWKVMEALGPLINSYDNTVLDNTIAVHPLFVQAKWRAPLRKHLARIPLGGGRPGYWEVGLRSLES